MHPLLGQVCISSIPSSWLCWWALLKKKNRFFLKSSFSYLPGCVHNIETQSLAKHCYYSSEPNSSAPFQGKSPQRSPWAGGQQGLAGGQLVPAQHTLSPAPRTSLKCLPSPLPAEDWPQWWPKAHAQRMIKKFTSSSCSLWWVDDVYQLIDVFYISGLQGPPGTKGDQGIQGKVFLTPESLLWMSITWLYGWFYGQSCPQLRCKLVGMSLELKK